ncbi:MAG: hypothetical protein ACKVQB_04235 [Bacteroidia bacterium]
MKAIKLFATALILGLSFISNAQIMVKVKPMAPRHAVVVAPARIPQGKVWIGGHWVVKGNNYLWQDGYYANHRKGYRFVEGFWKHSRHGWVWVPGKWRRVR